LPRQPKTKPDRAHANRFEAYLSVSELVDQAIGGIETVDVGRIQDDLSSLL